MYISSDEFLDCQRPKIVLTQYNPISGDTVNSLPGDQITNIQPVGAMGYDPTDTLWISNGLGWIPVEGAGPQGYQIRGPRGLKVSVCKVLRAYRAFWRTNWSPGATRIRCSGCCWCPGSYGAQGSVGAQGAQGIGAQGPQGRRD